MTACIRYCAHTPLCALHLSFISSPAPFLAAIVLYHMDENA